MWVVLVADVSAVLVDVAGLLEGEDAADTETDGAATGRDTALVLTLGLRVASAVAVSVARPRTAQAAGGFAALILEFHDVE